MRETMPTPAIRINVNAVIIKNGRVLLIKFEDENGFHYNLPGGGLKAGESVYSALHRECWEEARAQVEINGLILSWQYVPELENYRFGPQQKLGLIFSAQLEDKSMPILPPQPDPNQVAVEWISLQDLFDDSKGIILFPEIKPDLEDALRKNRQITLTEASPGTLLFKPINITKHQDLCIRFREDSFVTSFGLDRSSWPQPFDPDRYLEWLHLKTQRDPFSAVHVWLNGKVIGQMELGFLKENPEIGYVNLYYLTPEYRGKGLSASLDKYAMQYLVSKGHRTARLSVSPENSRAINFYKKNNWIDLGPREGFPGVNFMEKKL